MIEDGTGSALILSDIRVLFTSPWSHPGFGAVSGTNGMQGILVAVCADLRWTEIREA